MGVYICYFHGIYCHWAKPNTKSNIGKLAHTHALKTKKLYPTKAMLLPQSLMQTQTAELLLACNKEYLKKSNYKTTPNCRKEASTMPLRVSLA